MPIDKEKFLAGIADAGKIGDPAEEEAEGESMSCGEQLMAAIDAKDPSAIDAALQEAVAKYGSPSPVK